MTEQRKEAEATPNVRGLCLDTPLYKAYALDASWRNDQEKIIWPSDHLDSYCIECGQPSIFQLMAYPSQPSEIQDRWYTCLRDKRHSLFFSFRVDNQNITKVGQYPSLADIVATEIQKYRKILGSDAYREFSKAVGLAAHGVGISAFVYLRRIFERLIEEAHQEAKSSGTWHEDAYLQSRMDEKIHFLRDLLPQYSTYERHHAFTTTHTRKLQQPHK